MIPTCTAAMHQCLQSADFAQSAVIQCSTLAKHIPTTENHIAHAVAVFSELGIGVSSAVTFDPFKLREYSSKVNKDALYRQDLLSQAKLMGGLVCGVISFVTSPKWRWIKYYFFPLISIIFGCIALFGMSGLIFNLSDNWWLFFGVLSFLISIILPILMTAGLGEQPKVKQTLTKTLETQID